MTDFADALEHVRRSLGSKPRFLLWRHRIGIPDWARNDPRFRDLSSDQRLLLREGAVVWGAMVQANNQMFRQGLLNAPGNMIYSNDPRMDRCPSVLRSAARNLFTTKEKSDVAPELRAISRVITDELCAAGNLPVPVSLTEGIPCVFTEVLFERRHLPGRRITTPLMPLLVHNFSQCVMIVPYWHWPKELLSFGSAAGG